MTRSRWSGAISFRRPTTSSLFSRACSIAFEWRFSLPFTLDSSRVLSGDADLRGSAHLHEEHFPPSLQLAAVTLCALLLASKVWPDNTPTNEDFCSVYPQFDQEGFNDLESMFITDIQWNL